MNEIVRIPIENIRPFAGQPRSYFDEEALQELADSIKSHGQSTPAWVTPLPKGKYELIAGERRWRACKLAGVPTLLCEVREGLTEDQRYIASVMENFGRKDCTTMETARSVGAVLKLNQRDFEKTAKVFARSSAWVRQFNSLLRLAPEVAALLEPPAPILNMQAGLSLSNLQIEVQVRLAKEMTRCGLRHRAALRFIQQHASDTDRIENRGARRRKPSDDYELLQRFLVALGPQAQEVLSMGADRMASMFHNRPARDLNNFRAVLRTRAQQLLSLEKTLANV